MSDEAAVIEMSAGQAVERCIAYILAAKRDKDVIRYHLLDLASAAYEAGKRDAAGGA